MIKEPKIGDKIYVPSESFLYRGEDDFSGGLATINRIERSDFLPKTDPNYLMVGIEERRATMYNYKTLAKEQNRLKKEYRGRVAHSSPDLRPEFNQPDADWR